MNREFKKVLKTLEKDYGWTFWDEKGKLHLTDMQKELISDSYKVGRNARTAIPDRPFKRKPKSKVNGNRSRK